MFAGRPQFRRYACAVSVETIAATCAITGALLVVACVAIFDWRAAIGVAGGFLLAVGLLIDRPYGRQGE